MIFPSNRVRIMVATKPIDFRKGHDSLAAMVKNELHKDTKSEGKTLGRPARLNEKQKLDVLSDLAGGMSVSALARKFDTSRQTIMRVRIEGDRSV